MSGGQQRHLSREEQIEEAVRRRVQQLAPAEVRRQIISGDDITAVQLLNSTAEAIGREIARQVATSQIRNIFSEVRTIEQSIWGLAEDQPLPRDVLRDLLMLRPKLAYQFGRSSGHQEQKVAMGVLTTVLSESIALVGDNQRAFRNFVDFFEAILAYHRRYGGRTTEQTRS
jgi:CRISPR-associated protein Csm2